MSTSTIQFGVLCIPYQTLDVAGPIDILSSCDKESLSWCGKPASLIAQAIDIQFHHIGLSLAPVQHTANYHAVPTVTIKDCPKLDYLLIGGPYHTWILNDMEEEWKNFIRERIPEVKKVFTTCTGGMVLAATGVLDGLNATTNHEALELAKEMSPKVNWVREQWVVDGPEGKFSTAGGACAGMDMIADWVMRNYIREVADIGFKLLDFVPRNVKREQVVL